MNRTSKLLFSLPLLAGVTLSLSQIGNARATETDDMPVQHDKPIMRIVATSNGTNPVSTHIDNGSENSENESISDEELELMTLLTMAEAEGEPEEGKRLVIDTILNRVDSDMFPDSITEVIYQSNQFEAMWNGRIDKCYVMDDIKELVVEELESRTDYDVIFFNAGDYSEYGVPMYQIGNHYFSSYD